jgi:hypothetical protein
MLRIRLREHHEFDIRGIAPQLAEGQDQVVDFIGRQSQPPAGIGLGQRRVTLVTQDNAAQRSRCSGTEQALGLIGLRPNRFGHAIVQQRAQILERRSRKLVGRIDEVQGAALQPADDPEPAHLRNVRGFARPRGYRPQARGDQEGLAALDMLLCRRPVGQQLAENLELVFIQSLRNIGEVHEARGNTAHAGIPRLQQVQQFIEAKLRQRGRAEQAEHAKF